MIFATTAPRQRRTFRRASVTGATCLAALVSSVAPVHGQVPDSTVVDSAAVDSLGVRAPFADSLFMQDTLVRPSLAPRIAEHVYAMTHTFVDTPYGMGLIPTGLVEARIAEAYVRVAGQDSANTRAMKANMVHVVHAIDPGQADFGQGLGYGFKRAAEGVRTYIDLAADDPAASPTLLFHAPYVRDAATNALALADDAVAMARSIQTSSETEAEPLLERLEDLAALIRAMAWGSDRDRDGRIGNNAAESGLAQAGYHLELVRRVEGLDTVPALPDSLPIPVIVRATEGGRR